MVDIKFNYTANGRKGQRTTQTVPSLRNAYRFCPTTDILTTLYLAWRTRHHMRSRLSKRDLWQDFFQQDPDKLYYQTYKSSIQKFNHRRFLSLREPLFAPLDPAQSPSFSQNWCRLSRWRWWSGSKANISYRTEGGELCVEVYHEE